MPAQTLDLAIESGADFSVALVFLGGAGLPRNLTGASVRAQIVSSTLREVFQDWAGEEGGEEGNVVFEDIDPTDYEGGEGASYPGRVVLAIDAEDTADFLFASALWSLELSLDGVETRERQGAVSVSPRRIIETEP